MFTINLPPKQSLMVRCTSCKQQVSVKENKTPAPFQMAFNHPRQEIKGPCPKCGGQMVWRPEEAVIADATGA